MSKDDRNLTIEMMIELDKQIINQLKLPKETIGAGIPNPRPEKTILEEAMEDAKILKEQAIANAQKALQEAIAPTVQEIATQNAGHDSVTKAYLDLAAADTNWIQTSDIVTAQPMTGVGAFTITSTPVVAQTFPMMDIIPWTPLNLNHSFEFSPVGMDSDIQPVTISEENIESLLEIWRKEQTKYLEQQFKNYIRDNGPLSLGEDKILCLEGDNLVTRNKCTKEVNIENRVVGILDGID